jgi:thymidine kinase
MSSYNGSIEIILGPMFCGKSTELIRRIRRSSIAKKKCVVFKYEKDIRYETENDIRKVLTHDKQSLEAVPCSKLYDVVLYTKDMDIVGIDEGQFFPDIVEFCEQLANSGKTVIIAALDGDYLRRPFGRILEIVPLAEYVTKLKAVCMKCQEDASFTKRTVDSSEIELIGGAEAYISTCRKCYHEK